MSSDSTDILSLWLNSESSSSSSLSSSSSSSCSWCDKPFNCLILITCHCRPETEQWHLLIICPALVHTSVHPVRGSDCLLVASVCPRFILTFYMYPCISFAPTFSHSRAPPLPRFPTYFNFNLDIIFHLCSSSTTSLHVSASLQPRFTLLFLSVHLLFFFSVIKCESVSLLK